jgi:polysaccharide export outer membrane protein
MMLVLAAALALQNAPEAGAGPRPEAAVPAAGVSEARGGHRIGPDDVLRVVVYGHADLVHTVVVEPDGTFVFPLVGRVKVLDLTSQEAEGELTRRLADGFIRNPVVSVVVQSARSRTVFVIGEVARPGAYTLVEGRTLVGVLSRAGPLLASAGTEVVVLRALPDAAAPAGGAAPMGGASPMAEVQRVPIDDLQSGVLTNNVLLQPGDTVLVPRASRVFVTGHVRRPGAFPLTPGVTARQAIGMAGGFSKRGNPRVRIVRRQGETTIEVVAGVDDLLLSGDTLVVEKGGP